MSIKILLLVISAATISSCNTAYKSGQTPDDVYYSPLRVVEEDSNKEEEKDNNRDVASNQENAEEREMRMKIQDRRWRDLNDDYDCNCSCDHTPYKYGYNNRYYYNPYYYPYPVYLSDVPTKSQKNTVRMIGLGGYNTTVNTPVVNPKTGKTEYIPRARTYNNSNQQTREVFTPSNNNNRTYSPSSNSSGSNSNSGSGKSVSRPSRN